MFYNQNNFAYITKGFETGRGFLEPMSAYQPQANPNQIETPGAFGLPRGNAIYSAFKVFSAMGNESRQTYKANVEGYGGYSFNQLFSAAAHGTLFNRDQVS